MPQAPLTDARNWIPVICGCMLLTVASMIYESHESYKLFAFVGVLVAASMIFFMIYLMKDFASLNVNGAALVYTIWLIRGTMIRVHQEDATNTGLFSDEQIGGAVSTCLLLLVVFTFVDRERLVQPLKKVIFGLYLLIMFIPHTCSSSYALHGWRMTVKTLCFLFVWFLEDYYYACKNSAAKLDVPWWFNAWTDSDYAILVSRSLWILFVHEYFLLGIFLVAFACFAEIYALNHPAPRRQRDEEAASPERPPRRSRGRSPSPEPYDEIDTIYSPQVKNRHRANGTLVLNGQPVDVNTLLYGFMTMMQQQNNGSNVIYAPAPPYTAAEAAAPAPSPPVPRAVPQEPMPRPAPAKPVPSMAKPAPAAVSQEPSASISRPAQKYAGMPRRKASDVVITCSPLSAQPQAASAASKAATTKR